MNEQIIKSAQAANLLTEDIRAAHKEAIRKHPVLEILLADLMVEARDIETRLNQIRCALEIEG